VRALARAARGERRRVRWARRNLRENLPLDVALVALETIDGPVAVNRIGQASHWASYSRASTRPAAEPTGSSTASTRQCVLPKSTRSTISA
jgi:hypothetical protein